MSYTIDKARRETSIDLSNRVFETNEHYAQAMTPNSHDTACLQHALFAIVLELRRQNETDHQILGTLAEIRDELRDISSAVGEFVAR